MALTLIETILVSAVGGSLSGYAGYLLQQNKLKREYQLQDSAQRVAHKLLSHKEWNLRSFKVIHHHLGGFDDKRSFIQCIFNRLYINDCAGDFYARVDYHLLRQ